MNKITLVLKKVGIVALHWIIALTIVAALDYITNHTLDSLFGSYIVKFGIPVAVVNMIQVAIVKFLQKQQTQFPLPGATNQPAV